MVDAGTPGMREMELLTLKDVAIEFSPEEWECLDPTQRVLLKQFPVNLTEKLLNIQSRGFVGLEALHPSLLKTSKSQEEPDETDLQLQRDKQRLIKEISKGYKIL
ncbi:zinc finger protein 141-like [Carlito syrichta]|uniref:Zinc finger protein 141-like n=1 Tax=Carlito syrichta TaxID=1868482 RepID=A0A3Q0DQ86_CARSF|nr:zinc finger protein 141-like [Carlito syrichta]